jgi:hypothetical protein
MLHFLLIYGDASGLSGIVITEGLTLIQARTYIAARGIDNGAPFAEGHVLSPGLMASVLPNQIGRMLYGAEAVQLIRQFEGQRGSEE